MGTTRQGEDGEVTHWLEAVRRGIATMGLPRVGGRALILGDPSHRASHLIQTTGMDVVRVEARRAESARHADDQAEDATVQAMAGSLPYSEGAFDLVVVDAMLEFCHDDRKLIEEVARVLRDGGQLVARLPRRGRLAALDALNLYRYVTELTGKTDILPEAEPIGWRRHYEGSDLTAVFGTSGLLITDTERGGYGLGEAAYLPGLIATRAIADRPRAARRLRDWYDRFGDLDERLPGPATFVVTAVKSARSIPVEQARDGQST